MIRIELFGGVRVLVDDRPVESLSSKQRQVLAILALDADVPVSREHLVDLLWSGRPPRSHVSTLDSYVCTVRKALGLTAGAGSPLATTPHGLVLRTGGEVAVDVAQFRELCRAASTHRGREALALARRAADLARGDLLGDLLAAEWTDGPRREASRLLVTTATAAAQRANGLGEHPEAAALARLAVSTDALTENAWYQLVLASWLGGDRARALATYAEYRDTMAESLGEAPCQASEELYLSILRSGTSPSADGHGAALPHVRTLLRLLRQELEQVPGVRPPALDRELSAVAVAALAGVGA